MKGETRRVEVNLVVRFSEADGNAMTCVDCVKLVSGDEDYDSWMFKDEEFEGEMARNVN